MFVRFLFAGFPFTAIQECCPPPWERHGREAHLPFVLKEIASQKSIIHHAWSHDKVKSAMLLFPIEFIIWYKAGNLLVIRWSTLRYKMFPMYIQSLSIYTKSLMVTSNEFVSKYLWGLLLVFYKLTKHTQMGISIRDLFVQITWSEKSHPKCGWCHLVAVQIKRTLKEERKKFAIGMFSFTLAGKFIYPVTSEILNWYESQLLLLSNGDWRSEAFQISSQLLVPGLKCWDIQQHGLNNSGIFGPSKNQSLLDYPDYIMKVNQINLFKYRFTLSVLFLHRLLSNIVSLNLCV